MCEHHAAAAISIETQLIHRFAISVLVGLPCGCIVLVLVPIRHRVAFLVLWVGYEVDVFLVEIGDDFAAGEAADRNDHCDEYSDWN